MNGQERKIRGSGGGGDAGVNSMEFHLPELFLLLPSPNILLTNRGPD